MSLLFSDNFDTELTLTPVWDSASYGAIDRTAGHPYAGVGCCAANTFGPIHLTGPVLLLHAQTYWRSNGSGAGAVFLFLQESGGGPQLWIGVNTDGSVFVANYAYYERGIATSAPGVVPLGVYARFDAYVEIGNPGAVVVLVNGVQVLNIVADTIAYGTTFCGGIQLYGAGGGNQSWHDQFSLYDWDGVVSTIPSLEPIAKLQPHRTMYLQGFDAYGAAAALWGASESGFSVSGVFRDTADFAVLVLWDADDAFGHPRWAYLPDWDFSGITLSFDISFVGIQPFESQKSAYADWPTLNALMQDGTIERVRLDSLGTAVGTRTGASATFTLNSSGPQQYDRTTLWYQNLAFDYIVPYAPTCVQAMWWTGNPAYVHSVTIGSNTYSVAEGSLTSAQVAINIAGQITASDPNCTAVAGGTSGNEITVTAKAGIVGPLSVSSSDGSAAATMGAVMALASIAAQINAADWTANGPVTLAASVAGNALTITAAPGSDGNMVTITELHKNTRLYFTPASKQLSGGSSDGVTWSLTVDFSSLGWTSTSIQRLWLTFAAALANSGPYGSAPVLDASYTSPIVIGTALPLPSSGGGVTIDGVLGNTAANGTWPFTVVDDTHFSLDGSIGNAAYTGGGTASVAGVEWEVSVTDWRVADTSGASALKVAGPGSVRIEEDDAWVRRYGYWEAAPTDGFAYWSQGQAIRAAAAGAALTIETHCGAVCDIYVGTRLDTNCGIIGASLDGGAAVDLDCYAGTATTSQLRRLLFAAVAAGQHSVTITLTGAKNVSSAGWYFYFDFLECAVLGDVPGAPETLTNVALATDFDTNATYSISPERLLWGIQKSGLTGEIDHYAGVFFWAQRTRVGGYFGSATVTFGGTWAANDVVWLTVGAVLLGKTVFPTDTLATIAAQFANFINATLSGVWASASEAVLTIVTRSTGVNWEFPLSYTIQLSAAGTVAISGSLESLVEGTWTIDPTQTPALNRAFRDWHADWFSILEAAGMGVVASFSQELVNTPDGTDGVWVQRFPDGAAAQTATGIGSLYSSQAAFGAPVQAYMIAAYAAMAALMVAAGLPPRLQFGEVLWWYQADSAGMAFYDADTSAAAWTALGHALHTFLTPDDSPAANGYADATFLRARLANYVAAVQAGVLALCATAVFELLWPEDVNDPGTCQLMYYINLPAAWKTRSGSGFDTFVCEGFSYAGVEQNLNLAKACAGYPFTALGWDQAHCRYLEGWYYAAWAWEREYLSAGRTGVPLIKFWAWDHLCLFGWTLPLPSQPRVTRVSLY